jgi:hypothetical protein
MPGRFPPAATALLQWAVSLAAAAIPSAGGVSVSAQRQGRPRTIAASAARWRLLDGVQYRYEGGPCLEALAQGRRQFWDSSRQANKWPFFYQAARDAGIAAVLSVPLRAVPPEPRPSGSLNVYLPNASNPPEAEHLASIFADHLALLIDRHVDLDGLELPEEDPYRIVGPVGPVLAGGAQRAGLASEDLYLTYLTFGGEGTAAYIRSVLDGTVEPSAHEYNIIAQAINDRFIELGYDDLLPDAGGLREP